MANTFNHNGKVVINDDGQMSINTTNFAYVDDKLYVDGNIIIPNNRSYLQGTTGGNRASIISLNSSNNLTVGQSNLNNANLFLYGGTGNVTINAGATEVARFTTSGNVGIGTTSPSVSLQVNASTAAIRLEETSASAKRLEFSIDSSAVAKISANQSAQSIAFETVGSERMRITDAGNVGIGTASPVSISGYTSLDINNATNGGLIQLSRAGVGFGQLYNNASEVQLRSIAAVPLAFGTNSSEKMRITSAGNVGIGTTSPTHKLQVVGPGTFASTATAINGNVGLYMTIGGSANNYNGILFQGVSVADMYFGRAAGAGVDDLIIFGGGELVRFKQNGNVGIGTTSPSYKLQAEITDATAYSPTNTLSAAPIFWAYNSNATAGVAATIRLDGGQSGGNGAATISSVHVGSGSSAITFGTRNSSSNVTERVRIDNLGNVGIGTTSPTNKLHVNGGSIFNQDGFLYMSNQFPIVWGAAVSIEGDNAAGTLTLKTESSHRIFINNVGNVGVGTTSPTNRLTVTTATNAVDVLRLNNTGGDSGSVQGVTHLAINHFNAGTNPSTRITAYQDSTSGWPGGMYFSTRSLNTDSAPVERMRITSGGNVGIATATPNYTLHVAGDVQIDAEGNAPSASYVPDGGFGLDSLVTSSTENIALGKPDVWLRIHVDGVAFVFPGYQEP